MIRRLRSRHRRMILLLSLALPLAVAAALLSRRPPPRMEALPDGLLAPSTDASAVGTPRVASWDGGSLRATLLERDGDPPGLALSVEMLREVERPELLLYWSGAPDDFPSGAHLLGRLTGRHPGLFDLPAAATLERGRLILYSPAEQEVVVALELPAAGETG